MSYHKKSSFRRGGPRDRFAQSQRPIFDNSDPLAMSLFGSKRDPGHSIRFAQSERQRREHNNKFHAALIKRVAAMPALKLFTPSQEEQMQPRRKIPYYEYYQLYQLSDEAEARDILENGKTLQRPIIFFFSSSVVPSTGKLLSQVRYVLGRRPFVKFYYLDSVRFADFMSKYEIKRLPYFLMFSEGEVKRRGPMVNHLDLFRVGGREIQSGSKSGSERGDTSRLT